MRPAVIHLRILNELVAVIAEPLSTIYRSSWESGDVPAD